MSSELRRPARWRTVFNSLFGEILLWLLIILLLMWAIGVVMIYNVSGKISNEPYDAMLADTVRAVGKQVRAEDGRVVVNLPSPARDMLVSDTRDKIYFQVSGDRGVLIAGDNEIPWIAFSEGTQLDNVLFRDDDVDGEELRVAYMFMHGESGKAPLLIQVAETRNKRNGMAARIVTGVIVPQFAIVPLAVLFIYFAVSRGITPLHRLQEALRDRRPADLTAINIDGIPAEIRPLIEALNETMSRLDESLQGQRRFVADAAHQLKTPLTGLRTQAELAARETSPERLHACIAQMTAAIDRLSNMTQKLLMLARAESVSEQEAQFEMLDLCELVPEIAREVAPRALAKNIDLTFDTTQAQVMVKGSPLLLREMFANLLDNAILYTPASGTIAIRINANLAAAQHTNFGQSQGVVVEIEDSGIGIAASDRERVFSRFYRILGHGVHGSGLGLSIVKEIAELHHIKVTLHAGADGQGTLARVLFRRQIVV